MARRGALLRSACFGQAASSEYATPKLVIGIWASTMVDGSPFAWVQPKPTWFMCRGFHSVGNGNSSSAKRMARWVALQRSFCFGQAASSECTTSKLVLVIWASTTVDGLPFAWVQRKPIGLCAAAFIPLEMAAQAPPRAWLGGGLFRDPSALGKPRLRNAQPPNWCL